MQVSIKQFNVDMSVKSKGIEFEVRSTEAAGNEFLGDCVLTMTGLTWCPGKTSAKNGVKVSWEDFTAIMASPASRKAAVAAAKAA